MTNFTQILNKFRKESFSEREKGYKFEKLIKAWLKTDSRYSNKLSEVWLWEEFPAKKDFGGKDLGIDLVAKTDIGDYWAIQCKCYDEKAVINKEDVDSFLATSSRTFVDPYTFQTTVFRERIWVSTTNHWGANAEESIQNQNPKVTRIGLVELETSPVDWDKLLEGKKGNEAKLAGKQLMEHQLTAISKASEYYKSHDRGKLIMACGTGKTYTSLKMMETLLHGKGLVLFMVPSIALLGQTLNAWTFDAAKPIKAICICSDAKASRKASKDFDDNFESIVDLALPASTDAKSVMKQLLAYQDYNGLVVVFSTYQSVDAVSAAQQEVLKATNNTYGKFDFIVCDEAHRTTGVKISDANESSFTKIHSNENVQGEKRLYMTATPRLYGESAKVKASEKDLILCSMDDESLYGKEIHRVNFSYAVQNGLLTDYKVLVLTVSENDLPDNLVEDIKNGEKKELNYNDTTKLIGVINGLSKAIRGDEGATWNADPRMMRRAVAFCSSIGNVENPGTSKNIAHVLPLVSQKYNDSLEEAQREHVVHIQTKHVDGSMNSQARNEILAWLKDEAEDPQECRVVTNVRCLSEGVDVPALDAVLFLAARNSQVDVVQSVGRVMRNFRKGQADEKKYGYIIIPIVVPMGVSPEEALNDNARFKVVWDILNALRSHDDRFNAEINQIALNKKKDGRVIAGGAGLSNVSVIPGHDEVDTVHLSDQEVAQQLNLRFGDELREGIYAKLVEKCGDRLYWENWAKEVGMIARTFIERISTLILKEGRLKDEFEDFVKGLQKNLNPSVTNGQAIEMLAQHMITRPVFDALFEEYHFVKNNAVSRSMQMMIELLEYEGFDKDTEVLKKFYESVRTNVGRIDNLEGKQTIIKNLYKKFFKGAFPLTVDQLGIVYTPVECVDFIIHSVNDILKKEFDTSLTEENVHILDPFTGTGTFITRLLQSGLIRPEDMERKYLNEIHCNELVLLAYYIADVNIESVFHSLSQRKDYLPYEGICLTDTFQLNETGDNDIFSILFKENSERVLKQKKAPVRVIIGNPPYSVGQKSANDNAQNLKYAKLEERIAKTYAAKTDATNKNSLYDSYIKAFRWASDRLTSSKEGGIIAFISNGAWLDGNAQEGMRKSLEKEFSDIYVLNLRGNQRTSGELSRKEGGKIFGSGSRTPIAITFLVKNTQKEGQATIHYYDIGDYLSREDKLGKLKKFQSISSKKIDWQAIEPNDKADWINQRDGAFDDLIILGDKANKDNKNTVFFPYYSRGLATARDAWCYNFSEHSLIENITLSINFYNENRSKYHEAKKSNPKLDLDAFLEYDSMKGSWNRSLKNFCKNNTIIEFEPTCVYDSLYRPFMKIKGYFNKYMNDMIYQLPQLFPTPSHKNLVICVSGLGGTKENTTIITNCIPDLNCLDAGTQCFPLYWYEEAKNTFHKGGMDDLFASANDEPQYIQRDGITDWILQEVRNRYGRSKEITKEHIFYYVYGLLHSPQYRERFAADLKKSLPRIPIVDKLEDFLSFYKAGKKLADLHLNYETVPAYEDVHVVMEGKEEEFRGNLAADYKPIYHIKTDFDYYAVDKMKFPKKGQKDTIIYNHNIRIENIPAEAYEYVVNGKSAIEWIMERYQQTQDKKSLIKNNPNDWSIEHNQPCYILDLLLSVINVSVQTVEIVKGLPVIPGI